MKVWKTADSDRDRALFLAKETNLPIPVLYVLVSRGIDSPDSIEKFLNPRLSDLSDPFRLPDMRKAVDRIRQAIKARQQIVVHGDFDADGVTSTALMVKVLKELGAEVAAFLPDRIREGYGLTRKGLERCLSSRRADLIITVDCGTNAEAALKWAAEKGVDVVVTDHHEVSGTTSPVVAVVNPKLISDARTEVLAGVGVAFKVCHALIKDGIANGDKEVSGIDLRNYLDYVAVGTVADVVPLTGENRILVRHGLSRINETSSPGLKALIEVSGVKTSIDSYHLSFIIAPRLNAAGRMGAAEPALELLLTDDVNRSTEISEILDALNTERRRQEESISDEAAGEIQSYFDVKKTAGIVTGREGWHVGIIGIVASGICGKYNRPVVVVGFDKNGDGRGSCRSIESIDIVDVLNECSDLLVSYGGHRMAAGLSIKQSNFEEFKRRFNESCRARQQDTDLEVRQRVDAWIDLRECDDRLFEALQRLKPFGLGNPGPVWGTRAVNVVGTPRKVGNGHLKMTVAVGGTQIDTIAFNMGEMEVPEGPIDILYGLQENVYMGRRSLQLNIKDFRAARVDQDRVPNRR